MNKVLVLLVSLISTQNVFSLSNTVSLNRVNGAQVNNYQEKLTKEIEKYGILGNGMRAAMVLAFAYWAYNHLRSAPVLLGAVNKNEISQQELSKIRELINQGFLRSAFNLFSSHLTIAGMTSGMAYLQSKAFKDFDIYLIIREKTNIPTLFTALKKSAAVLDSNSEMFGAKLEISLGFEAGLKDIETTEDQKKVVQEIAGHLESVVKINNNQQSNAEILELKTLAVTRANMTDEVIKPKLDNAKNFINILTLDLEKVLAFMQYKFAYYSKEHMIDERDESAELIEELRDLIERKRNELSNILTKIQTDINVVKPNGLLASIFDYYESLEGIIKRFNRI